MPRVVRYCPPVVPAASMPGVSRGVDNRHCDTYTGEKAALVAAGLLPAHLFPGEVGLGKSSATFYTEGMPPVLRGMWPHPGSVDVSRLASGRFTIRVTPDAEELERRRHGERQAVQARRHNHVAQLHRQPCSDPAAPSPSAFGPAETDRVVHGILDRLIGVNGTESDVRASVVRWLARSRDLQPARRGSQLRLVR